MFLVSDVFLVGRGRAQKVREIGVNFPLLHLILSSVLFFSICVCSSFYLSAITSFKILIYSPLRRGVWPRWSDKAFSPRLAFVKIVLLYAYLTLTAKRVIPAEGNTREQRLDAKRKRAREKARQPAQQKTQRWPVAGQPSVLTNVILPAISEVSLQFALKLIDKQMKHAESANVKQLLTQATQNWVELDKTDSALAFSIVSAILENVEKFVAILFILAHSSENNTGITSSMSWSPTKFLQRKPSLLLRC